MARNRYQQRAKAGDSVGWLDNDFDHDDDADDRKDGDEKR